jgi:hypothetical protein
MKTWRSVVAMFHAEMEWGLCLLSSHQPLATSHQPLLRHPERRRRLPPPQSKDLLSSPLNHSRSSLRLHNRGILVYLKC